MRRADRLFRLVQLLRARRFATGEQIAGELGLFFWGLKWTLAAWCELRQDYRSSRPDRTQDVRLLQSGFDPADGISLAGFLAKHDPADRERWEWRHERAAPPEHGAC